MWKAALVSVSCCLPMAAQAEEIDFEALAAKSWSGGAVPDVSELVPEHVRQDAEQLVGLLTAEEPERLWSFDEGMLALRFPAAIVEVVRAAGRTGKLSVERQARELAACLAIACYAKNQVQAAVVTKERAAPWIESIRDPARDRARALASALLRDHAGSRQSLRLLADGVLDEPSVDDEDAAVRALGDRLDVVDIGRHAARLLAADRVEDAAVWLTRVDGAAQPRLPWQVDALRTEMRRLRQNLAAARALAGRVKGAAPDPIDVLRYRVVIGADTGPLCEQLIADGVEDALPRELLACSLYFGSARSELAPSS